MCFAFRARARWKCGLPSLESAPRTWSMLLEHWKPSAEEAVRPLPRTRKGLQAALNIWPPCPSWRRRTGNQATHAQKKSHLGMWMIIGLDFLTPQVKSEEWNLSRTGVPLCWGSHWVLYTGSAAACRDMYKCYSAPSHLKTIDKVLEDQKQEKPTKKWVYWIWFVCSSKLGYSKLPSLPLIIQFFHSHMM